MSLPTLPGSPRAILTLKFYIPGALSVLGKLTQLVTLQLNRVVMKLARVHLIQRELLSWGRVGECSEDNCALVWTSSRSFQL
jgi:hypothetical protein